MHIHFVHSNSREGAEGVVGWIFRRHWLPRQPRQPLIACPMRNSSCRISSVIERRVSDSGPTSREFSKEHSARSGRLSTSSIGGSQPLNRLARLLNQRPSFTPSDEIPRRLSWERYVNEPTVRRAILKCVHKSDRLAISDAYWRQDLTWPDLTVMERAERIL